MDTQELLTKLLTEEKRQSAQPLEWKVKLMGRIIELQKAVNSKFVRAISQLASPSFLGGVTSEEAGKTLVDELFIESVKTVIAAVNREPSSATVVQVKLTYFPVSPPALTARSTDLAASRDSKFFASLSKLAEGSKRFTAVRPVSPLELPSRPSLENLMSASGKSMQERHLNSESAPTETCKSQLSDHDNTYLAPCALAEESKKEVVEAPQRPRDIKAFSKEKKSSGEG